MELLPQHVLTKPGKSISTIYRKQPKSFMPVGKSIPLTAKGEFFIPTHKPTTWQMAAWYEAARKEPYLRQGLNIIIYYLINLVGTYEHPDPLIDAFVTANIENKIKRWIYNLTKSVLVGGYGCSEKIKTRKVGPDGMPQIWLEDLVNYHPMNVDLVLNDYGVVAHGEKVTNCLYKSGVYVPAPDHLIGKFKQQDLRGNKIRLPKDKAVFLTLDSEGNNPFGRSIVEAAYPYYLYKEAFRDLYFTALDRYGTPLIYFVVPHRIIETYEDEQGNQIDFTYADQIEERIQDLSSTQALVLTQHDKDNPVQVKALTTGNNFSDSFEKAIALCERNMMISLGIPNLLLEDRDSSRLGSARASETQSEVFLALISSIFDVIMTSFTEQAIHPLILENFDPKITPLAHYPGKFTKKPVRTTDLKVTVDAVKDLTEAEYISPNSDIDNRYVRELIGLG